MESSYKEYDALSTKRSIEIEKQPVGKFCDLWKFCIIRIEIMFGGEYIILLSLQFKKEQTRELFVVNEFFKLTLQLRGSVNFCGLK